MFNRFIALLSCLAIAGCTGPLAADAEPDRPSVHPPAPLPAAEVSGTFTVASYPFTETHFSTVNCFFVGPKPEGIANVTAASVVLEWTAESSATERLTLNAHVGDAVWVSSEGPSPLFLNWTADSGPRLMPFTVEVSFDDPTLVVPGQEVSFTVKVEGDARKIQTAGGASC